MSKLQSSEGSQHRVILSEKLLISKSFTPAPPIPMSISGNCPWLPVARGLRHLEKEEEEAPQDPEAKKARTEEKEEEDL